MQPVTDPALLQQLNGGAQQPASPTIYRTPAKPVTPATPLQINADSRADRADARADRSADIAEQLAGLTIAEKEAKLEAARIERQKVNNAGSATAASLRKTIAEMKQIETDTKGDYFETGTSGNIARSIPIVANDAKGLSARLVGLKGQNAFAALQELAAQGVKLTPISNAEIELAASSVANLDPTQSEEVFLGQLTKARKFYQDALDKIEANDAAKDGDQTNNKPLTAEVGNLPETGTPGEKIERNGVIVGFYDASGNRIDIDTGPNFDPSGNPISAEQLNQQAEQQRQQMLAERADSQEELTGEAGIGTRIASGATLGFNDEISGVVGGVAGLFNGEGVVDGYRNARDTKRIINQRADERTGALGTVAEIGGGLLLPGAGLAKAGGAIRQGIKAGAIGGGLAGAGYGEGVEGTLTGAGLGGLGGAALGAAIPTATGAVRSFIDTGKRALGRDKNVAVNQVSKALDADGNTPRSASKAIADAQSRNSPMSIADTGENTRQLLGSVSRQPGPARRIGVETTSKRQEEQLERISAAVRRDLGPTANIRELGEKLIDKARKDSKPLYEKFESNAGAGALFPKIEGLLSRPSMQKALKNAETTMKEEGVDPKSLGFDLDAQGEVVLTKVPSFKALDYIKRGADDVIEKYRDTTTGKLVLDGQGRAANETLRALITRIDKANPDYAAARAAYAGPAKMKSALEKGSKALRKSPDDIMAEMKNLTPSEKEMYRNGVRKGIVDFLEGKGDYADKVNALIGTEKSRKTLTRVFGGKGGFDRFVKTLRDEREIGLTYKAVNTGSPTAKNLAFDTDTGGNKVLSSAIDVADSANRSGIVGAVSNLIGKVREAGSLGTGKAGDEARESIAALLSETDPAELSLIIKSARRLAAEQRLLKRKQIRNAGRQGDAAGRGAVISTEDSRP